YHPAVAYREPQPPSGHVIGLRQGMEFNSNLLCTGDLKEAHRALPLESHFRISCVMADDYAVLRGKPNDPLVEVPVGRSAGRIIRIVYEHKPSTPGHFDWDGVQVRQEPVFFEERHEPGLAAREHCGNMIYGIGGRRGQRQVSRVDECKRQVSQSLLGTYQSEHLSERVQLDSESSLVPFGYADPEVVHTRVGRVLVVGRVFCRLSQSFDYMRWSR